MRYDAAIIGAGPSGLAAGIRLAHFGAKVCVFERHNRVGGLNSYYRKQGRDYDVGLHALTNYPPKADKSAPWPRLLRQLRLSAGEFDLCPQRFSEIRFPGKTLRFTNDFAVFQEQIASEFPKQADNFRRFAESLPPYKALALESSAPTARQVLAAYLADPLLIEMLMCPVCFYGCATENDMDFAQYAVLFRSIFLEGFSRPRGGIRSFLKVLTRKYKESGGELRLKRGVRKIHPSPSGLATLTLDNGEEVGAKVVFSSAGYPETIALCAREEAGIEERKGPGEGDGGDGLDRMGQIGRMSFVEGICSLDAPPAELGHEATIVFFSLLDRFAYRRPGQLADFSSGVLCCPGNFLRDGGAEGAPEGNMLRMSYQANYDLWKALSQQRYAREKNEVLQQSLETATKFVPNFRSHVAATDVITPLTVERFTGRLGGAIYGSPVKSPRGLTPYPNVFVCGADQGLVGIVGAMLSGVTMANSHVVYKNHAVLSAASAASAASGA